MISMEIIKFKRIKVLGDDASCTMIIETDMVVETKEILDFCIILIYFHEESRYEIIKYDGLTHGICHVHKYFEKT
jgi:hypothetical protein